MCASPLKFLRAGLPPPNVALLPDALFFTRSIPIMGGATLADISSQVELALEAVSPFPLAQLYYGWFSAPGADRVFVFAAYRRRFTTEQTAEWSEAELVLPSFAAVLGATVEAATTIVLAAPDCLTAVHWETPLVPARVVCRPLDPAATDEERARGREELLRAAGESKTVVDLTAPLAPDPARSDQEITFRAGEFVSRLPATATTMLDVRDKGELAARRSARRRDVLLWRVTLGCAATMAVLALGEFALIGGRAWQAVRVKQLNAQKPLVEKIMASQALANRIDELATKRLLPFEMITIVIGEDGAPRKPAEITFVRAYSSGLYTLLVEASTNNIGLVAVWENTVRQLPACESVEIRNLRPRGESATFQLVVTFKPDALKPMPLPGPKVAASQP
ncbi:MAG: hypothetical protein EXS38_05020 [Opitutus sp.]|nr:hypothetical protein [Opitutus sp.]